MMDTTQRTPCVNPLEYVVLCKFQNHTSFSGGRQMSPHYIAPRNTRRTRKLNRLVEHAIRCANGWLIQGLRYSRFAPIYDVCLQRDPIAFRREPRARE